ncbi:hypothetical protein JD844_011310 [Phrynosoma platyrhinos]|uniref:ABC transporter domain-containing protein n=1 Tax=Phrynosoma platyrhinos TaxID=52577 RepID=A0ABQ7THV4_PHRPL|nr:hypothetical protein JD844_011310 [Phrynosoma platyrhinos]
MKSEEQLEKRNKKNLVLIQLKERYKTDKRNRGFANEKTEIDKILLDKEKVSFLFGYSISFILFLYVIAFIFRKKSHPSSFWSFILILVTLIIIIIRLATHMDLRINLDYVLSFLVPMYPAITFLDIFTSIQLFPEEVEDRTSNYKNLIWMASFVSYLNSVILMLLLCCLVTKYGKPVMRRDPVFRISPQKKSIQQNPEEPSENDRDVEDERARVQSALASANQEEKPVVIVHNLRKEYKSRKICSCLKKNKTGGKVATRTVSFCVKKGEVLGLLGPNGAGKSTTITVITGDTNPTAGQVLIKGAGAATMEENTGGFLGYCPQENALWSNLTVKEHLEIYAAVKGIKKDAAAAAIDRCRAEHISSSINQKLYFSFRIAQALELQEHFKKTVKTLPAGLVRKLCFALSILGSPTVILFDEPTTGMDPKGKRQVWKAIHSVLKDKDQGAILTTHHMEEAEAVCDRVAIMVSGQLRCLGSIQYLKSKFGKNYLLQIKVKGVEEGELLNTQILQIFPHAARQERAKVFLEVCKEQERDNVDTVLDTTFEWKHLQEADL